MDALREDEAPAKAAGDASALPDRTGAGVALSSPLVRRLAPLEEVRAALARRTEFCSVLL
jgi:hypothetical protein